MTSQSFPNLCAQIRDDESFSREYVEKRFSSFFNEFSQYLSVYQKPSQKGFFKKSPLKLVMGVLENVDYLIDQTTAKNYTNEMIPEITSSFTAILHPSTPPEIRTEGVKLYYKLVNILGNNYYEFTKGFEKLVLDFTLLPAECVNMSKLNIDINANLRIQDFEPPVRTDKALYEHINFIFQSVLALKNTESFVRWWQIIQRRIIAVAYRSVAEQLKLPDCEYGINGKVPWQLQKSIISFLSSVLKNEEQTVSVLKTTNTCLFLDAIMQHCSTYDIKEDLAFNFIIQFIGVVCNNADILNYLKTSYQKLLPHLVATLLTATADSFTASDDKYEKRKATCTETLKKFYSTLYNLYTEQSEKCALCAQLANWTGTDNLSCRLHVASILLSLSVNLKVTDPLYWEEIVKGGSHQKNSYLSTAAYFASFYTFNIIDKLMSFDISSLPIYIDMMSQENEWHTDHGMWLGRFGPLLDKSVRDPLPLFFMKAKNDIIIEDISCDQVTKEVFPQPLNVSDWNREQCLTNFRVFFNAYDWKKAPEDDQYRTFLVCASVIKPILKMSEVFPPSVKYDRSFLLSEFLDWLKECIAPSVTNTQIIYHALKLLGEMICRKESIELLSDEALADFYLTLKHHISSNTLIVKQTALVFACRAILVGLNGANLLISSVAQSLESLSINIENGIYLSPSEKASIALAICTVLDVSKADDLGSNDTKQRIANKEKAVGFIEPFSQNLRVATLVNLIIEESIAHRDEVIDYSLTSLLSSLKTRTLNDVYTMMSLMFVLTELEETHSGSVARILNTLLGLIEVHRNEDESIYEATVMLTCDALIYSAYIIDVKDYFKRFETIANNWMLNKEGCNFSQICKQKLFNCTLYLATNFLRFPFPSPEFVTGGEMPKSAAFKSTVDNIIRLSKQRFVSDLPVGRYAWKYEPIAPTPAPREFNKISSDVNIPQASETEEQKEFTSKLVNYTNDLFNTQLPELGISASLCNPDDFSSKHAFEMTPNEAPEPSAQNIPPPTPGPCAAAFLTGLDFFDLIETTRLFPTIESRNVNSIDNNKFRHNINARFCSSTNASTHLKDFKRGLGFVLPNGNIVNETCRHRITFLADPNAHCEVEIVWDEGMTTKELVSTYTANTQLRFDISPMQTGLFLVNICVAKSISAEAVQLKRTIVSKRALPLFVISQIITCIHIINKLNETIVDPFASSGDLIGRVRGSEFYTHSIMLMCAKKILQDIDK